MMLTRTRFLLIALLFIAGVVGSFAFVLNAIQRESFESEAENRAHLVTQFGKASRAYTKETLRPAVEGHTDEMVFEAMSSTFVTRGIFEAFNKELPEYQYRQATRNPLNLDNKADAYEEGIIAEFEAQPEQEELTGFRSIDGEEYFYTARPIVAEAGCLKCHGSVESVRQTQGAIVEQYGTGHGFDWEVGEVVAAQMISVPTADLYAQYSSMQRAVLCVFAGLTLVLVGVSYLFFTLATRHAEGEKKARAIAERANESKSQFLANMSHEIRTPMTAILGFADTLREHGNREKAPQERLDAIETIRHNGQHLLTLINDILDLSKIEAGKMEMELIRFSPITLIAEVQSLMQMRALDKDLSFEIEFDGAIPEYIESDPTRVRQILTNVIGNAIKFTESGGVKVVLRVVESDSGAQMIEFDVVDTGIGMSEEQIGRLFQAFSQADTSTTRKFGGTGLGLNISGQLVTMLGGTIAVESAEGQGSVFRTIIPTRSPRGMRMIEDPASMLSVRSRWNVEEASEVIRLDARVLLVEDGKDNQNLISYVLNKAGATVSIVENGELSLDAALDAQSAGKPFDVILMDMQMPVMDGYDATRTLRARGYTRCIIALTAHAMAEDRRKCIKAGCDEFVSKPIDRVGLVRLIAQYTDGRDERASAA